MQFKESKYIDYLLSFTQSNCIQLNGSKYIDCLLSFTQSNCIQLNIVWSNNTLIYLGLYLLLYCGSF